MTLKPCPYHGRPSILEMQPVILRGSTITYRVKCTDCNATGPDMKTEAQARRKWNNIAASIEVLRSGRSYKWAKGADV